VRRLIRLMCLGFVLLLCACDVQLRDTTPGEYTANHDLGMYEVSVALSRDALVTPGSVYVFAQGDKLKVALSPNADGSEWHGLYSVRCRSSFPLQFVAEWKLPVDVRRKVMPPQPRQVRLLEPPLTRTASFDIVYARVPESQEPDTQRLAGTVARWIARLDPGGRSLPG